MITREFSPTTSRRIGKAMLVIAPFFAFAAAWRWHVESQFLSAASIAQGRVTSITSKGESAEVVFRDSMGRTHTISPWVKSSSRRYSIGEQIVVLVPSQDPLDAKFNEPMQIWATTHLFLYLSALVGAFGALIFKGILVAGPLKRKRISVGF